MKLELADSQPGSQASVYVLQPLYVGFNIDQYIVIDNNNFNSTLAGRTRVEYQLMLHALGFIERENGSWGIIPHRF